MCKERDASKAAKNRPRKLAQQRGKLKDSLGAWRMSGEEEERIFSSLGKNWKNTTLAIHTSANLAGSGKRHVSVSEMKRLLNQMGAQDDDQKVDKLVGSLSKLKKAGRNHWSSDSTKQQPRS